MDKKFRFLSVMGVIGSGKTTLSKLLTSHFGFTLMEEQFAQNQFLAKFYEDKKRWAFHSQTFFLVQKLNQLKEVKKMLDNSSVPGIILDTPLEQDVYSYARAQVNLGNMGEDEWDLYQSVYESINGYLPQPEVVIFLETPIEVLLSRIKKRGRPFEETIEGDYLSILDTLNREWVAKNETKIKIIKIDSTAYNLVENEQDQQKLISSIEQTLS